MRVCHVDQALGECSLRGPLGSGVRVGVDGEVPEALQLAVDDPLRRLTPLEAEVGPPTGNCG